MERFIIEELRKWKNSKRRKPLILRGARQVGKTWILEKFGKEFEDGFVKIDFFKEPDYSQFFEKSKDVERIIQNLSFAIGKKITKNTLIILDEIQECPHALNTLKYFCEDEPEYYVVSAGSLLGITLSEGFPVGKVDFLDMGPMTFEEFLVACGENNLYDYLKNIDSIDTIPSIFHDRFIELLKTYFVVGGMPEAVKAWAIDRDPKAVDNILLSILDAYEADFGKHAPESEVPKIRLIWRSLPSQLAKENKKFLYSVVKTGARAREYEDALNWLKNADLIKKVHRITKPELPIVSYEDLSAFKIYMLDVGLLRRHSRLASTAFMEENRLFTEFKGSLTENFVIESLVRQDENIPCYWSDETHEVDFVIQKNNDIYPVEVKAGINVQAASLKKYLLNYGDTKLAIRFSLKNLSYDGKILNVPLYLIDELDKLIKLAQKLTDKQFDALIERGLKDYQEGRVYTPEEVFNDLDKI